MWNHISAFAVEHWQAIGGFVVYSLIALIATMPVPGEPFHAYEWAYAWLHALINSPGAAKFRSPVPNAPPQGAPQK